MRRERHEVECRPVAEASGARGGDARIGSRCSGTHLGLVAAALLALMMGGCAGLAGLAGPRAAVSPPSAAATRPDLDNLIYAGAAAPAPAAINVVAPSADPSVYQLDSGDRLRIVVFGQDGLSNSYVVDAAGNITMPLIGAVPARGASTTQLAREVGARLRNGFIREPHLAIEIESYRPFFILGEVTYPGQYPFVPNMTVETAVAIAGGFTPRAYHWEAQVTRNQGGQPYRMAVPPTYALRPGDTVSIDERWF